LKPLLGAPWRDLPPALAARTLPTILAGTALDHLVGIVADTPGDQHLILFSWSIYRIFRLAKTAGNASSTASPS
jgi:hypothetical protein